MHCGEALPILTDDLIWEILLKLPVRSLVQLKCVCKYWKTLISHPQFAKNHLQTSRADPQLVSNITWWSLTSNIISEYGFLTFSVQEPFQNPCTPGCFKIDDSHYSNYGLIGSCNGLLCMCDCENGDVILWNPSIRSMSRRLHLLVEQLINAYGWGFGYDHLSDRYKMLIVEGKGEKMTTKVFTFGPNNWTVIPNFPCHTIDGTGNLLNGTLNWMVTKTKRGLSYDQQLMIILSFDLVTLTYDEVLLPDEQDTHKFCIPVVNVLRDSLCVSFFHSEKVHVWLMKEHGVKDSWTKLMIIPQFTGHYRRTNFGIDYKTEHFFQLLDISEDGVLLFKTSWVSKLILYNSNDGRFSYPISGKIGSKLLAYRESLVSPKC